MSKVEILERRMALENIIPQELQDVAVLLAGKLRAGSRFFRLGISPLGQERILFWSMGWGPARSRK